jgi:hypothetical protein
LEKDGTTISWVILRYPARFEQVSALQVVQDREHRQFHAVLGAEAFQGACIDDLDYFAGEQVREFEVLQVPLGSV